MTLEGDGVMELGDGVRAKFTGWAPDRDLNPQYAGLPDVPRWGLVIEHPRGPIDRAGAPDPCLGGVTFDTPEVRAVLDVQGNRATALWSVLAWEPLTLSPSVLCRGCGSHGWIRDGRWVAC